MSWINSKTNEWCLQHPDLGNELIKMMESNSGKHRALLFIVLTALAQGVRDRQRVLSARKSLEDC